MRSFQTAWRELRARIPGRGVIKRHLPRGLFARSLLIIVVPMVLLQAAVTYLFFERHYEATTLRLSRGVAGSIATLVNLHEQFSGRISLDEISEVASRNIGFQVAYLPGDTLPATPPTGSSLLDQTLQQQLYNQIGRPVWFDLNHYEDYVDIRVGLEGGVLRILAEKKRVLATNVHIFILWMVATAFVLIGVAILFLRNQVRPITRLAAAAEAFGRGRDVPDFKPTGATEVRAAALSFLDMKERLARHMQQRTDMLAGVSHDLRTPLTRMKLELAMMKDTPGVEALRADLAEMEHMLDEYLEFARGQGGEPAAETDVAEIVEEVADGVRRNANGRGPQIEVTAAPSLVVLVRRNAVKRCIANLVDNALKYGRRARIRAQRADGAITVSIEDDGPGIPAAKREEAFRPFFRIDEGRNQDIAGVGLGLAIARDIARGHGGDIVLSDSALGGLKAELRLPA